MVSLTHCESLTHHAQSVYTHTHSNHSTTVFRRSMDSNLDLLESVNNSYNAPKILIETLTARSSSIIIFLTYSTFIIGFVIDILTTFKSFESNNRVLTSEYCNSNNILSNSTDQANSNCYNGNIWTGIYENLANVISVQLNVNRNNLTNFEYLQYQDINVLCSYTLYACYQPDGCHNNFGGYNSYTWMEVLSESNYSIPVVITVESNTMLSASASIFPNTFQNQESIPSEGLVRSYYIQVEYVEDVYDIFSGTLNVYDITYSLEVVGRPLQLVQSSLIIVIMFFTIIVFVCYCYTVNQYNTKSSLKWLSEQKWIVAYFIAVFLYQNPASMIIIFSQYSTPSSAYFSYILDQLSQAILFTIWLAYSDSIHRKTSQSLYEFYFYKIFFGVFIFGVGMFIITWQFPSLNPSPNADHNPVESDSNWTLNYQITFCLFCILYLSLQWIWAVIWVYNIYRTYKTLNKLPYMNTRYLQLSHRFFAIQATAVMMYYFFQYFVVIYLISQNENAKSIRTLSTLTDNINTLFREQSQLFGKILFLTTYAFILAFLFLPASFMNRNLTSRFLVSLVLTERDKSIEFSRRKKIKNSKSFPVVDSLIMQKLVDFKLFVFCIELAIKTRDLSYQAYYDPSDLKTESSFEGSFDIDSIGFQLIDVFYDKEHHTFCFISRETSTNNIFVTFR